MLAASTELGERVGAVADQIARYSDLPDGTSNAIRICIAAFEDSAWPEVAWRFSNLNQDGCPVEFAFSSCDNALRFTTEVAGPEVDAHARLGAARDLVEKLQPGSIAERDFNCWQGVQSGCVLRWGCWLGLRQDVGGLRLKLYVEVPPGKQPEAPAARALVPGADLLMIGRDLSQHRTEYYFRQAELSSFEADNFKRCMASTNNGAILFDAFAELCEMPLPVALQVVPFGYSLSFAQDRGSPECSLFVRSSTLRRLGRIRQQFTAYERLSKRGSCYKALLGDLADEELPDHGMLSLAAHDDNIEMRVSMSAEALARLRFRSPKAPSL